MARFLVGIVLGVVVATALGAHAEPVEAALVREAAVEHNVNPEWLLRVARCESGLNRYAVSANNEYVGIFQLGRHGMLPEFFARGYDNPFDPAQSSNFAAEMFAAGRSRAWSCS